MRAGGLAARVEQARRDREEIITRVCGACGNKCCHQMTMMGSQDLRRLLKAMRLDRDFDRGLRRGLAQRAGELEVDLEAVKTVASLLEQAATAEQRADLDELQGHIGQWGEFVEFLRSDFPADMADLRRLLHFSAIRSNTLNCLARFPGAQGALVTVSGGRASFRLSGRRVAPPGCLFYLDPVGCLAGDSKPAKCANFFCAGEPNLLATMRETLSFDDFVLSNFMVIGLDDLIRRLQLERELGPSFVEPKVILAVGARALAETEHALADTGVQVRVEHPPGGAMRSALEVERSLTSLPANTARLEVYEALDGNALYELALALDRIRLRDEHPALVLVAQELRPAPMPHPMWDEQMMSQPLGALDLYVLGEGE